MFSNSELLLDVSRLIWRRWSGRLPTGIDRVCLAYLEHFAPRARAVVQFRQYRRILNRADSTRLFELLLSGGKRFRARLCAILGLAALRGESGYAGQIYLNVGHTGLNSPHLAPWLKQHRLKPVFLIHDLIPITHPQYCREGEDERHGERMTHALQSASGIIVNSAATETDLATFAMEMEMPIPACAMAWLGVDEPAPHLPAAVPDRPYFVLVGTIEARKNHLLILQVWRDLVARLGDQAPQLVIIGQRGWEAQEVFDLLDNPGPLEDHVVELGRCDDARMQALIAGARALLMPSFVEGYGLPLVEALEFGAPVIASDLPVFREIAGDIPEYCDPNDQSGWVSTIEAYAGDGPARQDHLKRMAGFRPTRWHDHFERVEDFLRTI